MMTNDKMRATHWTSPVILWYRLRKSKLLAWKRNKIMARNMISEYDDRQLITAEKLSIELMLAQKVFFGPPSLPFLHFESKICKKEFCCRLSFYIFFCGQTTF